MLNYFSHIFLPFYIIGFFFGCSPGEKTKEKSQAEVFRAERPPGAKKHAIVIVIDTLRADAIKEAKTPNLDALIANGAQARRGWSSGTWTAPSVISMFLGKTVREHGWDYPMPAKMALEEKASGKYRIQ